MPADLLTRSFWWLFIIFAFFTIPVLIFYEVWLLNRRINEKLETLIDILQKREEMNILSESSPDNRDVKLLRRRSGGSERL